MNEPTTETLAAVLLALEPARLSSAAVDKLLRAKWALDSAALAAAHRAAADAQLMAADLIEPRPALRVVK